MYKTNFEILIDDSYLQKNGSSFLNEETEF